jgi:hypothetical protein
VLQAEANATDMACNILGSNERPVRNGVIDTGCPQ